MNQPEMHSFVVPAIPRSANKQPSSAATAKIREALNLSYPNLAMYNVDLYGIIYFFNFDRNKKKDASNIGKHVLNDLETCLYPNDKMVKLVLTGIVTLWEGDYNEIDLGRFPKVVTEKILEYVSTKTEFTYIQIGPLKPEMYEIPVGAFR